MAIAYAIEGTEVAIFYHENDVDDVDAEDTQKMVEELTAQPEELAPVYVFLASANLLPTTHYPLLTLTIF